MDHRLALRTLDTRQEKVTRLYYGLRRERPHSAQFTSMRASNR
jgi:hypothetical protein